MDAGDCASSPDRGDVLSDHIHQDHKAAYGRRRRVRTSRPLGRVV